LVKKIAIYGAYETQEPVWQRYWHVRKDGIRQRYWHKTTRMKKVVKDDGRFEFKGSGKDLYQAIIKAKGRVPKGYVDVDAKEFIANPDQFSDEGEWVDWDVIS
jgi:hypothetical protein